MRGLNAAWLISSYLLSRLLRKPLLWGMPISAGLELTNHCNLQCPQCATGSGLAARERGYMSKPLFDEINRQLSGFLINTMFYFQGESMMHPSFFEYLKEWRGKGIVISTNGHFIGSEEASRLASSPASKIIISLDGFSQEIYEKQRPGGDIGKVKNGIVNLVKRAKGKRSVPSVEIQFLVSSINEHEQEPVRRFARDLGIGFRMKSMQILDMFSDPEILPGRKKYSRYNISDGKLAIRSKLQNHCFRLWTNPVITWDGRVLPCCFDKDAAHEMGDLSKEPFMDIWYGEKYLAFRKKILESRLCVGMCTNCTEGLDHEIRV